MNNQTNGTPFIEYIEYHNKINLEDNDIENIDVNIFSKPLFEKNTIKSEKQKITFILAHLGTKTCLEILKQYYDQEPDELLKSWTEIALDECALFANEGNENEEETEGFERGDVSIMGGVGGLNKRLRMYVGIFKNNGEDINKEEQKLIAKSFLETANKYDSMLENCDRDKDTAIITLLLSIEAIPDDVIYGSIEICNKDHEFLLNGYYANNVISPPKEYLKKTKKSILKQQNKKCDHCGFKKSKK